MSELAINMQCPHRIEDRARKVTRSGFGVEHFRSTKLLLVTPASPHGTSGSSLAVLLLIPLPANARVRRPQMRLTSLGPSTLWHARCLLWSGPSLAVVSIWGDETGYGVYLSYLLSLSHSPLNTMKGNINVIESFGFRLVGIKTHCFIC